jgi:hypothetical protein
VGSDGKQAKMNAVIFNYRHQSCLAPPITTSIVQRCELPVLAEEMQSYRCMLINEPQTNPKPNAVKPRPTKPYYPTILAAKREPEEAYKNMTNSPVVDLR